MHFSFLRSPVLRFALLAVVAATFIAAAVFVPAALRKPTAALAARATTSGQPQLRLERLHLHSQHATKPDPGDG